MSPEARTPTPTEPSGGVRIRAHPGVCEGWGNCRRFAPAVYVLDDEGYLAVHVLEVGEELATDAKLGADVCPARAITVVDAPRVAGDRG